MHPGDEGRPLCVLQAASDVVNLNEPLSLGQKDAGFYHCRFMLAAAGATCLVQQRTITNVPRARTLTPGVVVIRAAGEKVLVSALFLTCRVFS